MYSLSGIKAPQTGHTARITVHQKQPRFGSAFNVDRITLQLTQNESENLIKLAADTGRTWLVKKLHEAGISMKSLSLKDAVRDGNIELVNMLIKSGAQVNELDSSYCTPLHYAIIHGANSPQNPHFQIFKSLLDAGANPDRPSTGERSARKMAYDFHRTLFIKVLEGQANAELKKERIKVLLAKNELGINGWELLQDVHNAYLKKKSMWDIDAGARHADLELRFETLRGIEKPLMGLVNVGLLTKRGEMPNPKWILTKAALELLEKYKGQELDKTDFVTGQPPSSSNA